MRIRTLDTLSEDGRSRERYRRMALTSAASLASRGVSMLASLVSIPLTFRYLGVERYGLWMILLSFISVLSFADMGVGSGVMNAISEANGKDDRELQRVYVTSGLVLMMGIAGILVLAGIAAFPFMPWIRLFNVKSQNVAFEGARAFLVLFSWFVLNIPLSVITRAQAGLQKAYWSQIIGAGGNIVSLLALVFAMFLHGSLPWLVMASTFGVIVATVMNGLFLFREHPWLIPSLQSFQRNAAKKILANGLMFFVLQCAYAVSYSSDNIVIAQIIGASAVAFYAVPQKLFGFVTTLVSMGISPLWPAYGEAISRGDFKWVRRAFIVSLFLTVAISSVACATLAFAGPLILRVAVGKSFSAPTALLVVLAVWGVVAAISAQLATLLNGVGVLKIQTIIAVIASLCNLTLSIYLTRSFGVVGVCLGSIITQLLITLPLYSWVIRNLFREIAKRDLPRIGNL